MGSTSAANVTAPIRAKPFAWLRSATFSGLGPRKQSGRYATIGAGRERGGGAMTARVVVRIKAPGWTRAEESRLVDGLDRHQTHAEIGRQLGRTAGAVKARAGKLRERLIKGRGLSVTAVGQLLGIDPHGVAWWIKQGWLPATTSKIDMGRGRVRFVQRHDLEAFLADERFWHLVEPQRITESRLRDWATDIRGGLTFLSTAQVGRIFGISHHAVNQLIRAGRLRAAKRGPNWLVRSDHCIYPVSDPKPRGPIRTEAEKDFIREWWGQRSGVWIAEQIGCTDTAVHNWARKLGLPLLGRGAYKRKVMA